MERHGIPGTLAALVVTVAVAACGTVPPSPSPSGAPGSPAPTSAASPDSSPAATPAPSLPTPPAADSWVAAGSLKLARASTHAVALDDGRVLVVGNENICTPGGAWDDSVAAEVFDPSTGTWKATGSLNAPRDGFIAVTLPDGRVLVAGGLTSATPAEGAFGAYSSAKLYDPASGKWSAAGIMSAARTEPVAALLADGTVLVAGGAYVDKDTPARVLASAEIYDPDTDSWSATGDMRTARRGAQAATLADGRVLVVGGSSTGRRLYDEETAVAQAEIFDPAKGTWSPAGSLAHPGQLVALADGGAIVVGGSGATERFDPKTRSWAETGATVTPASGRSAVLLGDGRVLVAGGTSGPADEFGNSPVTADAELYDPVSGTWTATTPLPDPREGSSFATLADRSVLLVGGDAGYGGEPSAPWCPDPVAAAVRYVPENLASFPEPKPIAASVAKSSAPRAASKPAEAKKTAASITAFGIDLYKRMLADGTLDSKENAVFSPTSIALALGMARAGAKGTTAAQMDDVLHTSGWAALGKGLNALEQALSSRDVTWKDSSYAGGASHELKLRIANGAFAQRDWAIVPDYLDRIAATFGAGLRLVNYRGDPEAARQLINAWVKQKTAGRIPELIPKQPPTITGATRLVLANAIYLKANWQKEFAKGDTKPRAFTTLDGSTAKVPTMVLPAGEQAVPLARGSGWRATELRYLGALGESGAWDQATPLAMTLILPDDLRSFEKTLTPKKLAAVIAKLDAQRKRLARVTSSGEDGDCGKYAYSLRLFMPQFGIDTHATLGDPLEELGMPLAFDRTQADFTGIYVPKDEFPIYIGAVIHQANIDVDEKGTEAAAATVVEMATGGCTGPEPAKTVTFRLDRPFLFVLRDVETGAILFMGRVVDPSVRG